MGSVWGENESFYWAETFMFRRERSKIEEAKGNYLGEVRQENIKEKNACEKQKGDERNQRQISRPKRGRQEKKPCQQYRLGFCVTVNI